MATREQNRQRIQQERAQADQSLGASHTPVERTEQTVDCLTDWYAVSFAPLAVGRDFISACGWDVVTLDHGGLGYESSGIILGSGRCYWSVSRNEMHISLGGQALAQVGDIRGMMILAKSMGGQDSRTDAAFDDRVGLLDWDTIEAAVRAGNMSTRWRTAKISDDVRLTEAGPVASGRIIRLGSRKSDTYLRIYDKQQQMIALGEPDPGHWIRVELEAKHDAAQVVGDMMRQGDGDALRGLLAGLIEFKEADPLDSNRRRWARAAWWDTFLQGVPKLFGLFSAKAKKTLDDVQRWIEKTVAPSLALAFQAMHGDMDYLLDTIKKGRARWNPQQAALAAMG